MYNEPEFEEVKTINKLNPWFNIWTKPRATVRSAISHNTIGLVILLAIIVGISNAWDNAVNQYAIEKF